MSNILNHVKYKNSSTQTGSNAGNDMPRKKVVLVKKQGIQAAGNSAEVVQQTPQVQRSSSTTSKDTITVSKPKRTTKGANPNKDIIQRANKGTGHKLNSFAGLADLFKFEVEADQEANQE